MILDNYSNKKEIIKKKSYIRSIRFKNNIIEECCAKSIIQFKKVNFNTTQLIHKTKSHSNLQAKKGEQVSETASKN